MAMFSVILMFNIFVVDDDDNINIQREILISTYFT